MKITFLGTKGYIEQPTDLHRMHTSALVSYRGSSIRIDCGEDWIGRCSEARYDALFITHCHPDHAWGLKSGIDRPVFATSDSWKEMRPWPISDRHTIEDRDTVEVGGLSVECFSVQHSTRCPAVGYRISGGVVTVFYVPDLVYIHDRETALRGCDVYIGDGATIDRNFVRKQEDTGELIGHVPVRTQLTWCEKLGVPRMIVTHCGSQIVKDHDTAVARIAEYAHERGVQAEIATDGMQRVLR